MGYMSVKRRARAMVGDLSFFKECCFRVRVTITGQVRVRLQSGLVSTLTLTLTLTLKQHSLKKKTIEPNPDFALY